jgi:hypothetical protein
MALLITFAGVLTASCSSEKPASTPTPAPATTAPADHQAILAPALADLTAQLGKPAKLNVVSLKTSKGFAFVYANIVDQDGRPIDYVGTPFAEAAANGGMSKKYVALLRDDRGWKLVTSRVGPTDVAWQNWAAEYSAPPEIFELPPQP